ncbi:poly-beta-1,6-N-acetyl-D-glucosamine synthase [Abditibacteriota bacterium]|nr:poly-beta-1,6-N-acetyl-D-glucosamine synthase [Abditibacteriota bacterium]
MSASRPIFFDPSGARAVWLRYVGASLGAMALVLSAIFGVTVMNTPAPARAKALRQLARWVSPRTPREKSNNPLGLWREIGLTSPLGTGTFAALVPAQATNSTVPSNSSQIVAAFYAPYQETGLASFRVAAPHLTHIMPAWVQLNSAGKGLNLSDFDLAENPNNSTVIQIARDNGVAIMPILSNAEEEDFNPQRIHALVGSPQVQQAVVGQLVAWLEQNHFQGLNLDFENVSPSDDVALANFTKRLGNELHAHGLQLSVDLECDTSGAQMHRLAHASDFSVLMAYDQHDNSQKQAQKDEDAAGPIAAFNWTTDVLRKALQHVPAHKLVLGVGNYGYDWNLDTPQGNADLTYQAAVMLAHETAGETSPSLAVDFDADALNATFDYADEKGQQHEVWMLDAASAWNSWKLMQRAHLRGGSLWVLGSEDPSVWDFWRKTSVPYENVQQRLTQVHFPQEVSYAGKGDILSVTSQPHEGSRTFEFDPDSGLIKDENYKHFPTSTVISRTGFIPKDIALTFDDGPDPAWTPAILDELHKFGVKATFFVVGNQAERNRGLVWRMWDEGHEIGNHSFNHPDLSQVSNARADFEINATQRAIEGITGHATTLFRAPYDSDMEPQTIDQSQTLQRASTLGYKAIGNSVDPQDWNPTLVDSDGHTRFRSAKDIEDDIWSDVHSNVGNIVLLHDAGGDRSNTIEALERIVPRLQKEGYRFVTVSDLMHESRAVAMPVVTGREAWIVAFDRFVFDVVFSFQWALAAGFVLAIGLGLARMALLVPLALFAAKRERSATFTPDFQPLVSVLVAAYNEEKVIERTIRSILASDYSNIEVVVVDDGSKDETFATVETAFGDNERVRVFRQQNGGKASALNHAISEAHGEIFVGFDADTQVAPDAISLMVRHFCNASVGAVAGNVSVGNRINIWTRWQAVEYITSQNLDRRAFGLLNAISVVPGAIGAWRREAVKSVGGYQSDTLAEDMDLTWRLHKAGWGIVNETGARAFTEAPDSLKTLFKQRFRWGYGTLQCLAKHRSMIGRGGWFGKLVLPMTWVFQFALQWLAPLVDIQLVLAALTMFLGWRAGIVDIHATQFFERTAFFTALFWVVELIGAVFAIRLDKEDTKLLPLLLLQRFVYRQMLYVVVLKATWTALSGFRQGWGKLARKGTVVVREVKTA